MLQTRPALVAGRYRRMTQDSFQFFRGNLPLFLRDWNDARTGLARTSFSLPALLVWSLGDAHPENFGILRPTEGPSLFEANDLDVADRLPFLWDLRRLSVGLCLAARNANRNTPSARAETTAAVPSLLQRFLQSYLSEVARIAAGGTRQAISNGNGSILLNDLFTRSERARLQRNELEELTRVSNGVRQFLRGPLDPSEPDVLLRELAPGTRESLTVLLQQYQRTLHNPPPASFFQVLDAVQQLGSGVGSRPGIRVLLLLRGPSDALEDDVLLQSKELPPALQLFNVPSARWNSETERALAARDHLWSQPNADALWGTGTWMQFPVLLRTESEAFKNLRVSRFERDRGSVAALGALYERLGVLLADIHTTPTTETPQIARVLNEALRPHAADFLQEQRTIAIAYCDRVETDWQVFRSVLQQAGMNLGVTETPAAVDTPVLRGLFAPPKHKKTSGQTVDQRNAIAF